MRFPDLARHLVPLAWASLAANAGIVLTGGAVRLTGSGLGCPTWPRCTDDSFVPRGELGMHEAIEFGNRMLTFVLVGIAVLTFVAAVQAYRGRGSHPLAGRKDIPRFGFVLAVGIPLQAVIGGVTVLTDLNPWIVSLHLLLSLAMISIAVWFLRRVRRPDAVPGRLHARGAAAVLAWATFATGWVVLYLGTIVTGAGPHAGDADSPRNSLDPESVSQLHTDAVFLFVGLTIGLAFLVRATRSSSEARRAVTALIGVQLAQGSIGFIQYYTGLPELLVGLHLLGAAATAATLAWTVLAVLDAPDPAEVDPDEADLTAAAYPST